jgi:hypothetical protein
MSLRPATSFVIGLLALAAICPLLAQQTPTPEPIADPEAYAVYVSLGCETAPVVVLRQQTSSEACQTRDAVPADALSAIDSYYRENARPWSLIPAMFLDARFTVVPTARFTAILSAVPWRHDRWVRIGQEFPGADGYWYVSAVGFDPTKTRAYVSYGHLLETAIVPGPCPSRRSTANGNRLGAVTSQPALSRRIERETTDAQSGDIGCSWYGFNGRSGQRADNA